MKVEFRECDFFDLWIWFEFQNSPMELERQYLEEVLNSWFLLGKLGGFNAENLQVQDTGLEISHMEYDADIADKSFMALMHNMAEVEYEGNWARCWFDLGTTDALSLDVLINALGQLDKDYTPLERVIIGGENADWKIPGKRRSEFVDPENN